MNYWNPYSHCLFAIKLIEIGIVQTCQDFNVNSDKPVSQGLPHFLDFSMQKLNQQ